MVEEIDRRWRVVKATRNRIESDLARCNQGVHPTWRALAGSTSLLVGVLGVAQPDAKAAQDVCTTSFDPYTASRATREACGIKSFPLRSKVVHADGAIEYSYVVDGNSVEFVLPPASFDFSDATSSELARFGVPPKPPATDWAERAAWEHAVRNVSTEPPPDELLQAPVSAAPQPNDIFAGYINHGSFVTAETHYIEPYDHGTSCGQHAAVFWTGLGGWNSAALAQAGTFISAPGAGNHQAFWQVLPDSPFATFLPFYATENQQFKAGVNHIDSTHYSFYFYDYARGESYPPVIVQTDTYDGSTGDFIAERPLIYSQGGHSRLTNFGYWNVTFAKLNGNPQQTYTQTPLSMYNSGHLLANTSGILNAPDGSFTTTWKDCA